MDRALPPPRMIAGGDSPPAWGWTGGGELGARADRGFPTRVGMDRGIGHPWQECRWIPHPRGDGPDRLRVLVEQVQDSPPAWGWTELGREVTDIPPGFPTRVGMDRRPNCQLGRSIRIPHPRGDGPQNDNAVISALRDSPPAWGWTGAHVRPTSGQWGFPTRVGMDRSMTLPAPATAWIPHPRGDGPVLVRVVQHPAKRPSLVEMSKGFPTRVGMDR